MTYTIRLNSTEAVKMPDNSFKFNVDLKDLPGDTLRCGVQQIIYPSPASYIPRRMWFSTGGDTWITSYTTSVDATRVNDYDLLFAKYGINTYVYCYIPITNTFARFKWLSSANSQIRGTAFSSSVDGINWSADGSSAANNIPGSGVGSVYVDLYEIDINASPKGTTMENIHIQEFIYSQSYDTMNKGPTNIVGHIDGSSYTNYTLNDEVNEVREGYCNNEVSGNTLRSLRTLNVYFTRVATPNVKEPVVLPWSMELILY